MTRSRWWIVLAAAALLAVLDLVGEHGHADGWWHVLPAFDLLYGLGGCVLIVLASKLLGSAWLQRRENYYTRER